MYRRQIAIYLHDVSIMDQITNMIFVELGVVGKLCTESLHRTIFGMLNGVDFVFIDNSRK